MSSMASVSSSSLNFTLLNSRRRPWQPNSPKPNSETSKGTETISRCLALTNLEPAVATFINSGLDRSDTTKLSPELISALKTNVQDETKHEVALLNARSAMVDYNSIYQYQANDICQKWLDLPDNPIVTAAVLENSIFFLILPIYSLFGHVSLQLTAADISQDERLHVIYHREAAMRLGVKPSKELNRLRLETVEWISQGIAELGEKWNLDRMIRNSNSLLQRGVSDLIETKAAMVAAPFELSNNSLSMYS
jgi:hypothetical protein